ncbi:MAG TPA: YMGG-like glycine zipper-containing protein [Pyrinomonadaceae bacterium]
MKKSLVYFVITTLLTAMFIFAAPSTSDAQSAYYRKRVYRNGRVTWVRVRKPSYYRRHRNRINMAIGTGAGALIGGLIGGKKGALIGAGAGLGGSALYTYKLNPKRRKYRKVRTYRRW